MKMATESPRKTDDESQADDDFDDIDTDEENPHDQLPSPEEYKANMDNNTFSSSARNMDNPQDGDESDSDNENHDLPTVDEYKSNLSFRNDETPKSRAGLYTFLCLVLLLFIVTAIAVPLALRNNGGRDPNEVVEANTGGGSNVGRITATPVSSPTRFPPGTPVGVSELPRIDAASAYLTNYGIADREVLNDRTSPQAKALNWIANEDKFKIAIPAFPEGSNGTPYSETRFAERWALAVLYYSTGGDDWKYKLNFLEPIDHCDWSNKFVDPTGTVVQQGVTECQQFAPNFDGEKVSRIEMSNNNLNGIIPKEIELLPNLKVWTTPFNAELKSISSLTPFLRLATLSHLELQYCGLTGPIPEGIGSLEFLTFFGIGNNFMTGKIPDSFFGLTNLKVLGMDDNILESSIIPFGKLKNIQKLYLEDNLITGQITEEIIRDGWQSMVDLDLSVNRLEGPIPTNIWSMENLEVVDIHGNDFIGQIPEIDAIHDKLFFFAVQDNSLDWKIPETISNLVSLKHLDISANQMVIPFPSTMIRMSNLEALYTGINGFDEHPIPEFLSSMTNLRELSMKQNKLTGIIPAFLGGLTDLQVLDLDFNQLRGTIPTELGKLVGMDTLMLNRNFLTGAIPLSFSQLIDIDVILLDANNITGNAESICANPAINTTAFSADCGTINPEIECSCCSICCDDSDAECNNFDWRINLDGIWEYDFQRVVYSFSQEILPASAKEGYGNGAP